MIGDLFLIALILCCFFACLQQRVEVLERIAADRKTALREKFLDLE